ncbi:MAG: class I SAM-dependent methyltransferase [Candidatus Bathyarchaeia archaeon]
MAYTQDYFANRKYTLKQQLVERHVVEVLRWATKTLNQNLMDGHGKRALDVGCAYGYTTRILEGLGYETCGVDVSAYGVRQAKVTGQSEFMVCDGQNTLPFVDETFDLVTGFDVLEHLQSPRKALADMVAACGGVLVCTTPNRNVEKTVRKLTGDYDPTHVSVKSPAEWKSLIEDVSEFQAMHVESFYDVPLRLRGKLFFKSFSIPTYGLTVRIALRK